MITGHFNIFPILEHAANNPAIPSFENKKKQAEYSQLIKHIIADVPQLPGWYLWGKFNDMGWWETVYLGKAGKQKTSSLYTRLYDELREECIAFWAQVYGREPMLKLNAKRPNAYKYRPPLRDLRKVGAQMVVWLAVDEPIDEEEVKYQEDLLIKIYRPTHNAARWGKVNLHNVMTEKIELAIEAELKSITSLR